MVDFARITVRAGDGGDGAGSFHKIKGKRYGKADGGDGGNGGNVYFEATGDLSSLDSFRFVKDYKAQNGQNGSSRRRRGATALDLVLKVPIGTQIRLSGGGYQAPGISSQVSVKSKTDTRNLEPGTRNSSNSSSLSDLGVEDLSLRAEGLQTEIYDLT